MLQVKKVPFALLGKPSEKTGHIYDMTLFESCQKQINLFSDSALIGHLQNLIGYSTNVYIEDSCIFLDLVLLNTPIRIYDEIYNRCMFIKMYALVDTACSLSQEHELRTTDVLALYLSDLPSWSEFYDM